MARETMDRRPGKVGSIATVLGLASDIGSPWQDFLAWLVLFAAVAATVALLLRWASWRCDGSNGWGGWIRRWSTASAATAIIGLVVFGILAQAQRAFGGPDGVMAEQVPAVAALQRSLQTRLDRLDDAIAVLRGEMNATREGIETLNETAAATREGVGQLNETADATRQSVDELGETADATRQGVEQLNDTADATRQGVEAIGETTSQTRAGVEVLNQQMEFSVALAIVDRVREARDGSNQGQGGAFAALLAQGYDFIGTDFSGVSFRGVDLTAADFSEAVLHFADFRGATLIEARLAKAGIRLGQADEKSDFTNADLSGVYAPLFEAQGANFEGAVLVGANFYGGNFRGARMAGADLQGAAFAFADLRGADLSGANLAGAHLVGALLDGAQLDGAIFDQTNMLAAVRDPATVSSNQRAGACRHQAILQYGYGRLEIVERWESSRFSSGYEYDSLNEYDAGFPVPGYDDLSLPVCLSSSESATGFNAAYPFDESFRLERSYLDKVGRRKKAVERFEAFRNHLTEGQANAALFIGSGAYRQGWIDYMTSASGRTEAVGAPYPDGDFLLPFLLRTGIVAADQVDWATALNTRYRLENSIRTKYGGDFAANTHWPAFLPDDAKLDDMPPEAEGLFREWTLARARLDYPQIVLRPPVAVELQTDGTGVARMSQNFYRDTPSGLNFQQQSWASSSAARRIISHLGGHEFFVESPALRYAFGLQKLLYVFPSDVESYRMTMPEGTAYDGPMGTMPVELTVAVDRVERLPDDPAYVAVYVTPIAARMTVPGGPPVELSLSLSE